MTTAYVLLEPGTEQPAMVTVVPGAGEATLRYLCSITGHASHTRSLLLL